MTRGLMIMAVFAMALSGCAVTLHGHESAGNGSTTTVTGGSVQGATRIGNARIGGAFGAPAAPNAPGGQVALSRGATGVLVLGVVAVGTVVQAVHHWLQPAAPRRERADAGGIAHTCSCYGWQPELTPQPPAQ